MNPIKLHIAAICTSALLFAACGSTRNDIPTPGVNKEALTEISSNDQFSHLIRQMQFIPLETSDDCLLGTIRKVVEKDSLLYVLADVHDGAGKELHCFTPDGKHLRKIGNRGDGPGEYKRLVAFDITGDTVLIFDDATSRIMCFDLLGNYLDITGGFIDPTGVKEICAVNGTRQVLLRSDIANYSPAIYSTIDVPSGEGIDTIVSHPFNRDESMAELTASGPIGNWDDTTKLIIIPYENALFGYSPSGNTRRVLDLDLAESYTAPVPGEHIKDFHDRLGKNALSLHTPVSAYRVNDWVVIDFYFGSMLWNLRTRHGYHTLNGMDSRQLADFPIPTGWMIGTSGQSFVAYIEAEEFLRECALIPDNAKFKPSSELIASVNPEDNPLIIRFSLIEE